MLSGVCLRRQSASPLERWLTVPEMTTELSDESTPDGAGADALGLYSRWEQYNWRIADLELSADRPAWDRLPAMVRDGLLAGLSGFFLGEIAVTETLAPIAHAAPRNDYQLYLCTQLADEARHVIFFRTCLDTLARNAGFRAEDLHTSGRRTEAFADVFERQLHNATAGLAPGAPRGDWHRAVTLYHLLAEGVLAMTVLHSLTATIRALPGLGALARGLGQVSRDEARHAAFGVIATRDGVREGHRQVIVTTILDSIPSLARALVDPERLLTAPALPPVAAHQGRLLRGQWESAGDTLQRKLTSVGLRDLADAAGTAWRQGCGAAVEEYERVHDKRHPSRMAHMAGRTDQVIPEARQSDQERKVYQRDPTAS
jgi:ribonucleoside-diphosphate reductase beta chain